MHVMLQSHYCSPVYSLPAFNMECMQVQTLNPFYWDTGNKPNQCWWHICRQLLAVMDIGHDICSQNCTMCHTNTALKSSYSSTQLYSWWNSHTQAKVRVGRSLTPGIYIYMFVCMCSSPVLPTPLWDIILKCWGSGWLMNAVGILHVPSADVRFCERR